MLRVKSRPDAKAGAIRGKRQREANLCFKSNTSVPILETFAQLLETALLKLGHLLAGNAHARGGLPGGLLILVAQFDDSHFIVGKGFQRSVDELAQLLGF